MKQQSLKEHKQEFRPLSELYTILAVVVAIILILIGLVFYHFRNYAAELASPLERGLTKAGGIKKCSVGDSGHGWDNRSPWYQVYYEMPENREKAIATISKIAADNGYDLHHASKSNRGPVTVDDKYIDNYFYIAAGTPSPYKDLEGEMKLSLTVNNDGPFNVGCENIKTARVNSGPNISAVGITIHLPTFY